MIHFLSNHKDTSALEIISGEQVSLIPHPYIEPEWSVPELREKCSETISQAVAAEKLVANGDYTLVSLVVIERAKAGKQTGFLGMKKLNTPSNEKDSEGNIVHRNILKPVSLRWV